MTDAKHTSQSFEEDLGLLKDLLLQMGGMIETSLRQTQEALLSNNAEMAKKVIQKDSELDQLEKDVDEKAISILALRQPAATDLRFVTSAMKICTDLERLGDITVNICERIVELSRYEQLKPYEDLPKLMNLTAEIITKAIDSFVKQSPPLAEEVLKSEAPVDQLYKKIHSELRTIISKSPEAFERGLNLIFISKSLERMADHATNIAEYVIFTVKGLDVRHVH